MIVLIGESASGKSTIEKELIKNFKYEKVVTFTTRPIRNGEQDGKDYWFVSENEFNSLKNRQRFFETAEYNGWQYGSPIIKYPKDKVIIVTPKGLRALQRTYNKKDFVSIYVKTPRRERLIRLLKRGDDIEEAYRRSLSDVGMFDGIEREVDVVVNNTDNHNIHTLCCNIDYYNKHIKDGDDY